MLLQSFTRFLPVLVAISLGMNSPASADMSIISRDVPKAQKVGAGRLEFLFWSVYDATLYAPGGTFSPQRPFALRLDYLIPLSGADIADRSIEEMKKQGADDEDQLAAWREQMAAIFPDVDSGVALTGVRDVMGHTYFYRNNTAIGSIKDPNFTARFFGIWLDADSSEPKLRQQLLGITS